jgi:transposase-like protein
MKDSKQTKAGGSPEAARIIKIDEGQILTHMDQLVRGSIEQALNTLLETEADTLCRAGRYEHSPDRVDTRAGHYTRKLHTKAGQVSLKMPRLRSLPFETAIVERYRRRESSVEEALMEMYLAGVSVRRVEDITEALWGERVSSGTVSRLNQQLYERIQTWLAAPLQGEFVYVFLDGIWLKRSWGGEVKNLAVLVAIGVDAHGFRQVLGVAEGAKEDKESWLGFMRLLKERGLRGTQLFVSDKCLGLVQALGETFPKAAWQRCVVHWYRNVLTAVPKGKVAEVAAMLKAIHAQEDREAAREKAAVVAAKLETMRLAKAAGIVREGAEETFGYFAFPREHWRSLRTNNPLERINREIRRRTRVVGAFPDGKSALMLVAARLRHIAGTRWGTRCYMKMERLFELALEKEASG